MDAPRSKHWHLVYYVIVRRKDKQDLGVTKTMCGEDCWTDHRLIVSKLNLRIQTTTTRQESAKDIGCLQAETRQQEVSIYHYIYSHLDALEHNSDDVDESLTVFRDTVHSSTMDSLGPVSRKHQDLFDENDKKI